MNVSPRKKKLIQFLFVLAVITLVANIILTKIYKLPKPEKREDLNSNLIKVKFLNALDDFGLQKDWIKNLNLKESKNSGYSYLINVPKDLPIPVILAAIYSAFYRTNVNIKSTEEKLGGKTSISLFTNSKLKLTARFSYKDELVRNCGSIGLLVSDIDKLKSKDIGKLIEFPQTFTALLLPSKLSLSLKDSLLNNRKKYSILLNDNIEDMDFRLNRNFSKRRLNIVIRTIIGAFPNADFYVIDDASNLYQSAVYPYIKQEFVKRKIKLIKESSFIHINEGNSNEVQNSLKDIVQPTKLGDQKLVLIHADNFELAKYEIYSLIKIGYKFINPSVIIFNKAGKKDPSKLK